MGDELSGFRLRLLTPDDGPAVGRLFAASPDTGMIRFRPSFQVDPYLALMFDGQQTGVVAEHADTAELVGVGLLELGDLVLRDRPTRYALLHSLVVHPGVRRHGVARSIVDWRLAHVRAALGDDALIVATIQKDNAGSFAAASRWATTFSSPISSVAIGHPSRPPRPPSDGLRVRAADAADLGSYAAGYSAFHADFDLWQPVDVPELTRWLETSPVADARINGLWVVEDADGQLLAGLGTTEVRRMTILRVDALPLSMRILNSFLHAIPQSGSMEIVRISRMWFRAGAEGAARALFEAVRWEARGQGNVVIASFDPRGPLGRMVAAPRWLPRTAFSLAVRAPTELRPDHPIEPVQ